MLPRPAPQVLTALAAAFVALSACEPSESADSGNDAVEDGGVEASGDAPLDADAQATPDVAPTTDADASHIDVTITDASLPDVLADADLDASTEAGDAPATFDGGLPSISPPRLGITGSGGIFWLNQTGDLKTWIIPHDVWPDTSRKYKALSASMDHICAVGFDDEAYCWGWAGGAVPLPSNVDEQCPNVIGVPCRIGGARVPLLPQLVNVSAGGDHQRSCGLTSSGAAYCWGQPWSVATDAGTQPVLLSNGPYREVAPSQTHACLLDQQGRASCLGSAGTHLGIAQNGSAVTTPTAIDANMHFARISTSYRATCGVAADRNVYCWGSDAYAALGDGGVAGDSSIPSRVTAVSGPIDVVSVSQGGGCAAGSSGGATRIECWGTAPSPDVPSDMPAIDEIVYSNAGQGPLGCVRAGEEVYCWGYVPGPNAGADPKKLVRITAPPIQMDASADALLDVSTDVAADAPATFDAAIYTCDGGATGSADSCGPYSLPPLVDYFDLAEPTRVSIWTSHVMGGFYGGFGLVEGCPNGPVIACGIAEGGVMTVTVGPGRYYRFATGNGYVQFATDPISPPVSYTSVATAKMLSPGTTNEPRVYGDGTRYYAVDVAAPKQITLVETQGQGSITMTVGASSCTTWEAQSYPTGSCSLPLAAGATVIKIEAATGVTYSLTY